MVTGGSVWTPWNDTSNDSTEIQKETRQIFWVTQELEASWLLGEMERFEQSEDHFSEMTAEMHVHWNAVKEWLSAFLSGAAQGFGSFRLYPIVERAVKNAEACTPIEISI